MNKKEILSKIDETTEGINKKSVKNLLEKELRRKLKRKA
jgi:hypothetical protein